MTGISAKIKEIFSFFSWVSNQQHTRKLFSPLAVPTVEEQSYWKSPGGFVWCVWDLNLAHSLQLLSVIPASRGHMLPLRSLLLLGMFTALTLKLSSGTDLTSVNKSTEASSNLKLSHLDFFMLRGRYILPNQFYQGRGSLWIMDVNSIGEDWPSQRQINKWYARDKWELADK